MMIGFQRYIVECYLKTRSDILRSFLTLFMKGLDEPLMKKVIAVDPFALVVFKHVDESMRRYAATRYYFQFAMNLHKLPVHVQRHPNLDGVRLLAFQEMITREGEYEARHILELPLNDNELLWCFRRLMPKAKKLLRSPRILRPNSVLFERLLSTTQKDLNECDAQVSEQEWFLCLYSTLMRYCLDLMSQHKPKHSRHVNYVMKAITLKCLTDPLTSPSPPGMKVFYEYTGFQRWVIELQGRLSVDVLYDVYLQQGQWLSDACDHLEQNYRVELLNVWMMYWKFLIKKPACMIRNTNPAILLPLIPYNIIHALCRDENCLPMVIINNFRFFFAYAMDCLSLGMPTRDAFGDASEFILKSARAYLHDRRISGLCDDDIRRLDEYFVGLVPGEVNGLTE